MFLQVLLLIDYNISVSVASAGNFFHGSDVNNLADWRSSIRSHFSVAIFFHVSLDSFYYVGYSEKFTNFIYV